MQTPKSRPSSLDLPQKKTSLSSPKIARKLKPIVTESDPKTKTIPRTQFAKVVNDRRSPRIPLNEIQKKRTGKTPELESQISQLQEELKRAKEELKRSEASKKEAQEEAEETKQQLMEINASEDSRIEELRKLSLERDKTWQSELEAMQRQHGMDSTALSCAINEVQKLKSKLFESESELENSKFEVKSLEKLVKQLEEDSSSSSMEAENLKEEMKLAKNVINQLKSAVQEAEKRYQEEYIQSTLQIRTAYEQTEEIKSRYAHRETELAQELERTKAEIGVLRVDKKTKDELTRDFKKLESDVMEKEMELQSLRSEMEKKVDMEAMEAELKRVKIQCEQWRKAAETAASILNNEEVRIDSVENVKMLKKFGLLLKKNHK